MGLSHWIGSMAVVVALTSASHADKVTLVAGGPEASGENKLVVPFGVAFDPQGRTVFVEMTGHRVRRINADGKVETLAGSGKKGFSGDGGPAVRAEVNGPHALVCTKSGMIYIADTWNRRVRKIDTTTGLISTIAGTGEKGYTGDGGPADQAQFGDTYSVAIDPDEKELFVADLDHRRVRAIDLKTGLVRTVAGNGKRGVPKDGSIAKESPLVDPRAVAADKDGNVWILERGGHALRVVDAQGKIRTVLGTGQAGVGGVGGVGGGSDPRQIRLNGPKHIDVDRDGSILIADTENHMIGRFSPKENRYVVLVGTGKKGAGAVDSAPTQLALSQPHGITLHSSGDLFISDSYNHRILRLHRK